MTGKKTTITVHTRERMVIRNLDGLDLRCGNCGASVDLPLVADTDVRLETSDRPFNGILVTQNREGSLNDRDSATTRQGEIK